MLVNSLCPNYGHYFPEKTMRTKDSGYTSSAAYCAVENEFAAFSVHTPFERVANASKKKGNVINNPIQSMLTWGNILMWVYRPREKNIPWSNPSFAGGVTVWFCRKNINPSDRVRHSFVFIVLETLLLGRFCFNTLHSWESLRIIMKSILKVSP